MFSQPKVPEMMLSLNICRVDENIMLLKADRLLNAGAVCKLFAKNSIIHVFLYRFFF